MELETETTARQIIKFDYVGRQKDEKFGEI